MIPDQAVERRDQIACRRLVVLEQPNGMAEGRDARIGLEEGGDFVHVGLVALFGGARVGDGAGSVGGDALRWSGVGEA